MTKRIYICRVIVHRRLQMQKAGSFPLDSSPRSHRMANQATRLMFPGGLDIEAVLP